MQNRSLTTSSILDGLSVDRRPAFFTLPVQIVNTPVDTLQQKLDFMASQNSNDFHGMGVFLSKVFEFTLSKLPAIEKHCIQIQSFYRSQMTTDFLSSLFGGYTLAQELDRTLVRAGQPNLHTSCLAVLKEAKSAEACMSSTLRFLSRAEEFKQLPNEESKRVRDVSEEEMKDRCHLRP